MKKIFLFLVLVLFCASPALALDVTLQWDANTETDLAGYEVFYDVDSGDPYDGTVAIEGASPVDVPLSADENPDPAVVEKTITGLPTGAGQVWFFVVKAYNDVGLRSNYSNEVSTQGPVAPGLRIIRVR